MSVLELRAADECRWDVVALGEVMLRLDPGDARIATTRRFQVWEGGGEYNVARGLRRCFGLRSAIVTALADKPVGRLIEDLIQQGGTDPAHLGWISYDGIGRTVRNGLNFTERGFGVRAPLGCSDRGNTAASQLAPGDIDWTRIFVHGGTRWFHCGGIFAALSDTTPLVCEEAMLAARAANVVVSYDLNYRPSLWNAVGGSVRAAQVNRRLVELSDVLFGNEEDLELALGFDADGLDTRSYSVSIPTSMRASSVRSWLHSRTCRSLRRHFVKLIPRRATTGALSVAPGRISTLVPGYGTSRSLTASAAATRSRRVSSTAC